jgi:hypothetical protein
MAFGDFQPLCTTVPSYTWCNLFYKQLQRVAPEVLTGVSADSASAPVGVNPTCGIPRSGHDGSLGNLPDVIVCSLSFFFILGFAVKCFKRTAAVGRLELLAFLALYLLSLPLQLLTTGSLLEQGSTPLIALTAIHAGVVVALFWVLLANGIVATQVVEDGSLASLIPIGIMSLISLGIGIYISLDIALGVTNAIGGVADPAQSLRNIPLFVIMNIWPPLCAFAYLIIISIIVLRVLRERKPMWWYLLAATLFIMSQLAWFLLGRVICNASNQKVDGSFIATLLESASVVALYLGWTSITEESWDDGNEMR